MTLSMWPRYLSSARRPAAVKRYSVLGVRPSKYLLQTTYCASSSLRAWTLRLPSVVFRSCLRSLKVSDSLTARALTMARRTRSCISRSSSAAAAGPSVGLLRLGCGGCSRKPSGELCAPAFFARSFAKAFCLATVVPRYVQPENDVEQPEARGHQGVAPRGWQKKSARPQEHEAEPHEGNRAHGEGASRDDARAVEQKPQPGQLCGEPRAVEDDGQQRAHQHRRREVDDEFSPGLREERRVVG